MSDIISKELLSEVLNEKIVEIKPIQPSKRLLMFRVMRGKFEVIHNADINIHELAHKCKEWAMNRGYGITSSIDTDGKEVKGFGGVYLQVECDNILYEAEAYIEPEAIFKACEWILEQKER